MTINPSIHSEDAAAQALLKEARALLKDDAERQFFDALFGGAASEDITRNNPQGLSALARQAWDEAQETQGRRHSDRPFAWQRYPGSGKRDGGGQ